MLFNVDVVCQCWFDLAVWTHGLNVPIGDDQQGIIDKFVGFTVFSGVIQ